MDACEVGVGLLGYGCVGSAVDRLLREQAGEIERATGLRLRVRRALVRDPAKPRLSVPAPGGLTTDFTVVRDDPSIGVVAEVMGGVAPTERYVRELLAAGKPVATANKQLLARRGHVLARVAEACGLPLQFEAAVCGAVPVVRTLCEALPPESVRRIVGIVNGTTNYLLTRMETGLPLGEALEEARRLGYAEADPSEDVTGADAAAKMALLASIAFGQRVALEEVDYVGIEAVTPQQLAAARAAGRRLRLVGEASAQNGTISAHVRLRELPETSPLALVPGAFNQVDLHGDTFGQLMLAGPGAGGSATATAIIADLLALAGKGAVSHISKLAANRAMVRSAERAR